MPTPVSDCTYNLRERLILSREEMRSLGYKAVDMLVDHFETLPDKPTVQVASRRELEARLLTPPPEDGIDPASALRELEANVFANVAHVDHPRFFAFIPSPGNFVSVIADALASGLNIFTGAWLVSSGPSMLEIVTIDWLRRFCGMPDSAGGLFTSGGSAANLTALTVALELRVEDRSRAIAYMSDQTHFSVDRALRILGFQPHQIRRLPTDGMLQIDPSVLDNEIKRDRRVGDVPFCVVANAGTTNTGAVDPLASLATLCRRQGLWFHVDAAYGGAVAITEEGRAALAGIERADSVTLDPHKWLFQPYEIGCVLVRDRRWLSATFQGAAEYLEDSRTHAGEGIDFGQRGFQLTRSFRALKLWLSIQVFGLGAFRKSIERGVELARVAEGAIREMSDWEIVTPAQTGIVTFRYAPSGVSRHRTNSLNRRLVGLVRDDGFAMLSSTRVHGDVVLRMCTINPRTSNTDILETLDRLNRLAPRRQEALSQRPRALCQGA